MCSVCDVRDSAVRVHSVDVQSSSHANASLNPLLYEANYNEMDFALVNKQEKKR
jgi:hypothetical protein